MLLACPGGISEITKYDLSIAENKTILVVFPYALSQDDSFIKKLATAFNGVKANNLCILHEGLQHPIPVDLNYGSKAIEIYTNSFITKPNEKIPGADIERKSILSPFIESGQLIWLYGREKSYKSWFTRGLAHVISYGGSFLGKYQAGKNIKVLYVDSEMPPDKLEKNAKLELRGLGYEDGRKFSVAVARAPNNPLGEFNLCEEEWQTYFNKEFVKYDVIFLDCYYSLTRSKTMPKELLAWLTPWKNKGKTFIVIDHTNKEDDLQGGLDKKRAADLCIEISRNEGQEIEVSFPAARYLATEDAQPFILKTIFTEDMFRFELVEESTTAPILSDEMCRQVLAYTCKEVHKMDVQEILAPLFGSSKSTIYDWIKSIKGILSGTSKPTTPETQAIKKQAVVYESWSQEKLRDEAERFKKLI